MCVPPKLTAAQFFRGGGNNRNEVSVFLLFQMPKCHTTCPIKSLLPPSASPAVCLTGHRGIGQEALWLMHVWPRVLTPSSGRILSSVALAFISVVRDVMQGISKGKALLSNQFILPRYIKQLLLKLHTHYLYCGVGKQGPL